MAHYVQIPKDLNDIKQKFMFGLTKRQVVSFGIGGVLGIPLFFLTRSGARIKSRQPKVTGRGKYVIIKIIKKVKGVF